jgi:hypothetical protein
MTSLNPLNFTVCYRKTIFVYVSMEFTEDNFLEILSEENKKKWATLSLEKRKKIWSKLKKNFPFNLGGEPLDPHNNWIEAWDTEENEEVIERWDRHDYIEEEISNAVSNVVSEIKQ